MRKMLAVAAAILLVAIGTNAPAQIRNPAPKNPYPTQMPSPPERMLPTGMFRFRSDPNVTCPALWSEQADAQIAPLENAKDWGRLRALIVRYDCGADYAYLMIGKTYMMQGDYSNAAAYFNQASVVSADRTTPAAAICKKNHGCGFSVGNSAAEYLAQNEKRWRMGYNPNAVAATAHSQQTGNRLAQNLNAQAPTCGKGFFYRDGFAYYNGFNQPAGCVHRDCKGNVITAEQAYDAPNCDSVRGMEAQLRDTDALLMAGPKPSRTSDCLGPIQVAMYQARVGRDPPNPCPVARKRK